MWNIQDTTEKQCSFCHKEWNQVDRLISGPGGVYICDECVDLYREHIEKEFHKFPDFKKIVQVCNSCGTRPPISHRYCYNCGSQLTQHQEVRTS